MREKITFSQLSTPLKIAVWLMWVLGVYTMGLLFLGFIIGILGALS